MIFDNLINLGVKSEMEFYQKREARITNLFALIMLLGLAIGVSTVFFISGDYEIETVLFTASLAITVLILNLKQYHDAATYLFVISVTSSIFILNQQYDDMVGNYLYYFPVIFCVALLHSPLKPNSRTAIFFAIALVSFVGSRIIHIPSLKNTTITNSDNLLLLKYNCILAFSITLILVYLVVKLINRQNNEVLGLLKKEREAQLVITQSLKEKDVLLAEIQHRVKNNLAIIVGLIKMQTEKAPCETSKQLMIDSKNRVMSMAMVHERLYRKSNFSKIDLQLYISELVKEISLSFPIKIPQVKIIEDLIFIETEITKAIPIGLIINEAITNTLKHAFSNAIQSPIINIKTEKINDAIQIIISDNGIGFPNNKSNKENSLGLSLIESLSHQIDAKVVFTNNNGAEIKISVML